MGWAIRVVTNKEVLDRDIDGIVSDLPEELSSPFGRNTRQPWGWSTGVDISQIGTNSIRLSGSYGISGSIAEKFAAYMGEQLEKRGYEVSIGKIE